MLKFKKVLFCFMVILLILSSAVFAVDSNNTVVDNSTNNAIPMEARRDAISSTNSVSATTINEDKYVYNTSSYTLSDILSGNAFVSATKFSTNPRNNGGIIKGNLFVISSQVNIESDVTYSDKTDKNGAYLIDKINSKSVINGNVYALADSFTLEAGSEIYGDLYVSANKLTIEANAVVHGNIFATAKSINFAGQVEGSTYITCDEFNMTYFAYIGRDLHLDATNATLDGVVYRNAYVTADNNLVSKTDFKVNDSLRVNYAENFTMSGKFNGDVFINATNLTLKNDNEESCIIYGNLKYATKNQTEIPDGIVNGEVSTEKFKGRTSNENSVASLTFSLFTLLFYVFAVVLISKFFAGKALEKLPSLSVANILKALAIGLASMFAILIIFFLLCLLGVGVSFAFLLIIAYLFLIGISVPLFLNQIANALKFKLHLYVKLLIVTAVTYLISLIPVVGSTIVFMILLTGVGNIILALFKRNK